jgi:hypothetical protein
MQPYAKCRRLCLIFNTDGDRLSFVPLLLIVVPNRSLAFHTNLVLVLLHYTPRLNQWQWWWRRQFIQQRKKTHGSKCSEFRRVKSLRTVFCECVTVKNSILPPKYYSKILFIQVHYPLNCCGIKSEPFIWKSTVKKRLKWWPQFCTKCLPLSARDENGRSRTPWTNARDEEIPFHRQGASVYEYDGRRDGSVSFRPSNSAPRSVSFLPAPPIRPERGSVPIVRLWAFVDGLPL